MTTMQKYGTILNRLQVGVLDNEENYIRIVGLYRAVYNALQLQQ